jgi:UDP-N-acetylglucosamine 2-epimerase (non-hydrolysing)
MEAGNRCFDQRVPEEINRKIVDHISDVNMTYSTIARNYLLKENLPPDMVIKTGSPMYEVLNFYQDDINKSKVFDQFNIQEKSYFLVSAHREENIETSVTFNCIINILNSLANEYKKPIIVSTHPRTKIKINQSDSKLNPLIVLSKPLGFFDYVKLQKSAIAVLSDSGTINEESSILNFPALNIRETHERPEAMEEGSVMMVGLSMERVRQALSILSSQSRGKMRDLRLVDDYSAPNVSDKVLRIIHSYTDYINRTVWKKY